MNNINPQFSFTVEFGAPTKENANRWTIRVVWRNVHNEVIDIREHVVFLRDAREFINATMTEMGLI